MSKQQTIEALEAMLLSETDQSKKDALALAIYAVDNIDDLDGVFDANV